MVLVWKPITDLPEDWNTLSDGELGPLLRFWNDQRSDLEQSGALATFTQRLAREWSIETGQIEGVYDLDRGITQTLIDKGINADLIPSKPGQKPPELIAAIIQDHADVLEGLFQFVKGERPLSKSYIHELHAALLGHQETTVVMDQFGKLFDTQLVRGRYKERPNNPKRPDGNIHQYCPPNQVDPEMERLLDWHEGHAKRGVPVEIQAAWLHHRFTQIHPYQDGNGRVARTLASLLFVKAGWFPLVVTRDDRERYIEALEAGDAGTLSLFIWFLVSMQKRALFRATQTAADVQPPDTVERALTAIKLFLALKKGPDSDAQSKAMNTANRLIAVAEKRLDEVAVTIRSEIREVKIDSGSRRIQSAEVSGLQNLPLPYLPNAPFFENTLALTFGRHGRIVIHAHAIGSEPRGLIGIVVAFDGPSGLELASMEPFQTNYAETYGNGERRFRPWLEESLVKALILWQKTL